MDVKCAATVKSTGKQCTYNGKYKDAATEKHYCGHHRLKPKPKVSDAKRDVEPKRKPAVSVTVSVAVSVTPWKSLRLPEPSKELRLSVLRRLRNRINRGPKQSDTTGYLYVYSLADEVGLNYWKIGMTSRDDLEIRLKEWQSKHAGHTIVLKRSYRMEVKATRCLERVVHLYLDHKRMYRYQVSAPNGTYLVSIWSATGDPIDDAGRRTWISGADPKQRLHSSGKMVEWFCLPWSELEPLLNVLVKYYSAPAPAAL